MCSRSVPSDTEVIRTLSGPDVIRTLSADAVAGASRPRPDTTAANRTPAATPLNELTRLFDMRQPCTALASARLHRGCRHDCDQSSVDEGPGRTRIRLCRRTCAKAERAGARGIRWLPKVELHVHLVGSARPGTVLALARRHPEAGVPTDLAELERFFTFRDFHHFLRVYWAVQSMLVDRHDIRLLVTGLAEELARQNVRYAEVTVTPYNRPARTPFSPGMSRTPARPPARRPSGRPCTTLARNGSATAPAASPIPLSWRTWPSTGSRSRCARRPTSAPVRSRRSTRTRCGACSTTASFLDPPRKAALLSEIDAIARTSTGSAGTG